MARNAVKVAGGKNLIDIGSVLQSLYGSDFSVVTLNGEEFYRVIVHAKSFMKSYLTGFLPNQQYSFSFKYKHEAQPSGLLFAIRYTDGTNVIVNNLNNTELNTVSWTSLAGKTVESMTFTYGTGMTPTLISKQFMLTQSNALQPFEPYKPINPPSKLLKEWEYVRLDGSHVTLLDVVNQAQRVRFSTNNLPGVKLLTGGIDAHVIIPNRTQFPNVSLSYVNGNEGGFIVIPSELNVIFQLNRFATINEARDYFNQNPLDIAYQLAQPQRTTERKAYPSFFKQYEPKSAQAKKGLYLDGTGYIQLSSMTMDAVEIDCILEAGQSNTHYIFDARNGLHGYVNGMGFSFGLKSVINFARGERRKIRIESISPFTDDVSIFGRFETVSGNREAAKGTIFSITCYLNGQVVAKYNAEDLTGNVLHEGGAPKNLLPSFDSGKWNLHANARAIGRDVLELNPNQFWQTSGIVVDVEPNKQYVLKIENSRGAIRIYNGDNATFPQLGTGGNNANVDYVIQPTSNKIHIALSSGTNNNGSCQFIQPQLYKVNPKNGQVVGGRVEQPKKSRRTLFSKR